MKSRQVQEFVTRSELQELEEQMKRQWKTLLILLALAIKSPVEDVTEAEIPEQALAPWENILFISADEESSTELSTVLGQAGFEVITAANHREALPKLSKVGLVILDEDLPDSEKTCSYIREELGLPIILLGSDTSEVGWERAVSMGADAYLRRFSSKPELVARMKAILRRYHSDSKAGTE